MKLALFSPVPPERSGIADYSALLLPALQQRADVVVPARGQTKPPRGTELSVYHVGNNPDVHGWIVDALRRTPGIVVLHDFVLHHLVAGLTLARKDVAGYLNAMERDAGLPTTSGGGRARRASTGRSGRSRCPSGLSRRPSPLRSRASR